MAERARLEQALTDLVRHWRANATGYSSKGLLRAANDVEALLAAPPQPSPEPPEDNGKCEGCERPFTDDDLRVWTSDDVCLCDPCYRELVKATSPEPPQDADETPDTAEINTETARMMAKHAIRLRPTPNPGDSGPYYRCLECALSWFGRRHEHPLDDSCAVSVALRHRAAPPAETTTDRRRSMQMVKRLDTDIPRRNCADLWTEAEKAIHDALAAVERAGAHPLLTYAVVLLGEAREKVADFVELPAPPAGVPRAQE